MKFTHSAALLVSLSLLSACSQQEYILPGEREDLRSLNPQTMDAAELSEAAAAVEGPDRADRAQPISLPAVVNHSSWTHLGGSLTHRVQHPALSPAPKLLFAASIGQGNDRKHRITAEPVVANGRVFTLDSRAQVVATSTAGATLWSRDLTPPSDRSDDASGGGLAYADGTIYVTSGFGLVSALDAATGRVKWQQKMDASGSGAPALSGGLVYVVSRDNSAWAIEAANGRVKWRLSGTPSQDGVVGVSSPAVTDRLVLLPFASGEVVAALKKGGARTWSSLIAGERAGRGYSIVTDITGEPVVKDGVIFTGNPVGRTVAIDLSGERLWTAKEGAVSPVWVTGGSVFLVSDEAQLVRLDAKTGERIWGVPLPYYTKSKNRKRKAIYANLGPVLAGGKLWVASSDGVMRGFNPVNGALVGQVAIPGGAATRPVVVNGTAYLVSRDGKLLALR
ncbi:PQQ-like beta-propeller repeat protein [Aliiroseovarius sp. F47248L]|uniref:PQQ-like beta-propeller repeat protein n=1 Tax=Aliiroseovarius sp. F47248L TaxID=2926420 RepID=UPI001FF57FAE|nr:PQQ-like beta-propeller repeat protein [Aliiroseovarius sp. F47248L]MCK0139073.1 PQQ-like beta-propeller repeat protein [Aliiroseovarius sp. F47248L]